MKNTPAIFILLAVFAAIDCLGQVNVSIVNMTNTNTGASINNEDPIEIEDRSSIRIQFTVDMSKPSNQVVNGNLYVYTKRSSSSSPQTQSGPLNIPNNAWGGSGTVVTYSSSKDITLNSSDFDATGGTLYAEFESSTGVKYVSSNWDITIVSPAIANNSINGNQTIFSGQIPSTIIGSTPTGGDGSYSYGWERRTTGSWSNINGANGRNYSPGSLTTTTSYRRIVSSGSASNSTSNTVTITVGEAPISNNTISAPPVVDEDAQVTIIGSTPSGGSGSYSYKWQIKFDNTWLDLVSNATGKNYEFKAFIGSGTNGPIRTYRRIVYSVGFQPSISNEITIEITDYPPITFNTIAFDGVSKVIGSVPSGGNGFYTYDYYLIATDRVTGEFLEYNTGFGSNKDFNVPAFFLNLSSSHWVSVRRRVKSVNAISTSEFVLIELGITDITNNTITLDPPDLVVGSNPSGATGTYTYNWEFWFEEGPMPLHNETGKDLTVPAWMFGDSFVNYSIYIRRRVQSGDKTSYSEWLFVPKQLSGSIIGELPNTAFGKELEIVYPNPTKGEITFLLAPYKGQQVSVVITTPSFSQEKIFEGTVPENGEIEYIIPTNSPKGIYLYTISNGVEIKQGRFYRE